MSITAIMLGLQPLPPMPKGKLRIFCGEMSTKSADSAPKSAEKIWPSERQISEKTRARALEIIREAGIDGIDTFTLKDKLGRGFNTTRKIATDLVKTKEVRPFHQGRGLPRIFKAIK